MEGIRECWSKNEWGSGLKQERRDKGKACACDIERNDKRRSEWQRGEKKKEIVKEPHTPTVYFLPRNYWND